MVGAGALVFAVVLGVLLSLSVTRPLAQLEHAAERVGTGNLESTIGVHSSGEVASAMKAFNKMTRDLRRTQEKLLRAERIAAWQDIARSIAHEIKNPLSPIQISIETMRKTYRKKHPDFEEIFWESTSTILEEVERLRRIVTEFSRFARMPRPRPELLAIGDVVSHVIGLHLGGDVPIEVEELDDLPPVRADREQLTQVLVNLVQNAADAAAAAHGAHGARVRLILDRAERPAGVHVRVQDNGPGIPPEDRLRVFEPYYTTKAEGKGTGLGLAIVHRIVNDYGGTIQLTSGPDRGTTVQVRLPALVTEGVGGRR
jgi:two-component system, NtrC family, nitrogen regulation sensor histidine kinase NtrY